MVKFMNFRVVWRIKKLQRIFKIDQVVKRLKRKEAHLNEAARLTHENMGWLLAIRRMEELHLKKLRDLVSLQAAIRTLLAIRRYRKSLKNIVRIQSLVRGRAVRHEMKNKSSA